MQSESLYRSSAAEFPHDNPQFDRGALWLGTPLCTLPDPQTEPQPAEETATTATAPPDEDPIVAFVRAVTEVALAYGPVETVPHIESLLHFGAPSPDLLSPAARDALVEGKILELTEDAVRVTDGFASATTAWHSILRGESGDLSACGDSTLDTWTADLVARLIAHPDKTQAIRRDLRRKGIAAFGMLG